MTTQTNDGEQLKTHDGFVDAVKKSTPLAFAELAAGLAEADRKKLSKAAQELLQQARPKERETFGFPTHKAHMARLALLAVGPRSQTCRPMNLAQRPQTRGFRLGIFSVARESGPNPYEQAAAQILADRKPDWADEWLASQIAAAESSPFGASLSWNVVRQLIRTGVCRKPDSPAHLQLLAVFGLRADFDEDPDLLEDAWGLFRVPNQAFAFAARVKPDEAAKWKESRGQSWPQIFYYYAHQGRIDRGRLLDASLKALWGEFNAYARAGLMEIHLLLAATEDERLARQSAYIELLRNPEAPVVAFALTVIKSLANAKGFDAEAALKALPAVFELKPKSQPKAALSLLKTLVRQRPDLKTLAIEAALCGLAHPESDVQLAALKCLESWRNDGLPGEKLVELRELVSPLARPQLNQLISGLGDSAAPGVERDEPQVVEPQATEQPASTADLRARIEQIAPAWRAVWKLDESLSAFEAGTLPPPADIDAAPRVLVGLSRMAPIADGQELIDAVAQALERLDSPMELERILDGLSQFGLERSGDFMARTSALRKRMVGTDTQMRLDSLLAARFMLRPLFDLLGAWLGIGASGQPSWLRGILQYSTKQPPVHEVLCQRAKMIRSRLFEQNRCGRLLSFPTHEHGWIDPRVFVERLVRLDGNELGSIRPDLRCGLLRLAPDFREQAIRDAADLPGPLNRIVRYALGDDEVTPSGADRDFKAEWLAAGRVPVCARRFARTGAARPAGGCVRARRRTIPRAPRPRAGGRRTAAPFDLYEPGPLRPDQPGRPDGVAGGRGPCICHHPTLGARERPIHILGGSRLVRNLAGIALALESGTLRGGRHSKAAAAARFDGHEFRISCGRPVFVGVAQARARLVAHGDLRSVAGDVQPRRRRPRRRHRRPGRGPARWSGTSRFDVRDSHRDRRLSVGKAESPGGRAAASRPHIVLGSAGDFATSRSTNRVLAVPAARRSSNLGNPA